MATDVEEARDSAKELYAVLGELVLVASHVDSILDSVVIGLLHLRKSVLLEPTIATMDNSRKIEIVKARIKLISEPSWRKNISKLVDNMEKVSRARNIACHSTMRFDNDGPYLASNAIVKIIKGMDLVSKSVNGKFRLKFFHDAILVGQQIFTAAASVRDNLERVSAEIERRGHND